MKNIFYYSIIAITAIFFHACDIVEVPVLEPEPVDTDTTTVDTTDTDTTGNNAGTGQFPFIDTSKLNTDFQVALVEEFTGHTCQNCPENTDLLNALYESKKKRMSLVAIHAGQFAITTPDYPYDFRTSYGDDINTQYVPALTPYPCAMVNRQEFPDLNNTRMFVTHSNWVDPIQASLGAPAEIALGVATFYDSKTSKYNVRVSIKGLEDLSGEYLINLLAVEDTFVSDQKDERVGGDKHVKDYEHKHVLRGRLNDGSNLFGEKLIEDGIAKDEWVDYTLEADIPELMDDPENCTVVAFLYDVENDRVIQTEDAHVILR